MKMTIMAENLRTVGVVGVANLTLLALIVLWRTTKFIQLALNSNMARKDIRKKIFFHVCLLLAPCLDIPQYVGFVIFDGYQTTLYAFHRMSAAALFVAYSITIYDWSKVLVEIETDTVYPLMNRRLRNCNYFGEVSLITLNIICIGLSLANFIYILSVDDLDEYLESYIYILALFVQIIASLALTCAMLYSGMRLYLRILGVTGAWNRSPQNQFSLNLLPGVSKEFRSALRSLNIVMATCSLFIFIQMLLLILNYALGYANQTGVYVGPFFFYWTFYSWMPLWGPISALLYLSRNGYTRKPESNSTTQPFLNSNNIDDNSSSHQAALARVYSNSSSTGDDSDSIRGSKALSDDKLMFIMGSNTTDTSISTNHNSGSVFFAEEFGANRDLSMSYMFGQGRYTLSETNSGAKEYIALSSTSDSDEKYIPT